MNKILYISYDGLTDPLGQSQVIPYLAGLSKKGYQFHIISCEKKEKYFQAKDEIKDVLLKNNISWHPIFYTKKPPILSTILDIYSLKRESIRLHKKERFIIIHCRSYISSLIGLWMKKKFGTRFIFDMRGFWADERVEGKLWKINNPVYKAIYTYFKKKELEFLSNADYTISLTEAGKKEIHSWKKISNQPIQIEVIPCCVDTDLFNPDIIDKKIQAEYKKKLNITEADYIVSYLGALGTWYLLEEMLSFFKELTKKNDNSKFLIISQENSRHILNTAKQLGVPHEKLIIIKAERNAVPTLLSLSDISIYFIKSSFSKKASSPTKNAEIMSMGIPIICNSGIGDIDLIGKSGCIMLDSLNDKEYNKAIMKLNGFPKTPIYPIRQAAIDMFSLQKGIDIYESVYKKIPDKICLKGIKPEYY